MTNIRFAKWLVWINGAVPAALLTWDALHNRLGANPVNFAIHTTGLLALIFLMLALLVSPLKQLLHWDFLAHFRRSLGLFAAFHAFAHFGIFFCFDRGASISSTIHEIATRNYLWFGTIALLIFIPLAATSTDSMIRRLGPARWKALHRLTYLAAIAAAIHYCLVGKYVTTQSIVFAAALGALLVYRTVATHVRLRIAYRKLQASAAGAAPMPTSRPRFWRGRLRVARTFRETQDVQTFRLAPLDGKLLPFDYEPGQYLNLSLAIDGKRVNRSYTIASSPTRAGYVEITVKREPSGVGSRHLHDMLKVGEMIDVSGPAGRFTFTGEESPNIVLIAAGVGITPLISKLRYLTDLSWPGRIDLIYSARSEHEIIFRHELEDLERRNPNVHVTITLTRADESWKGPRGRITPELLRDAVPSLRDREFHICGPDTMAGSTRQMLATLGVADEKVKFESFTPPSRGGSDAPRSSSSSQPIDEPVGEAASLSFARSRRSVETPDGKSVLECAEEVGVPIDYDCRSGICGTCKIKLLQGRVAMETTDALTAADRAGGLILACQARCLDAVRVDA